MALPALAAQQAAGAEGDALDKEEQEGEAFPQLCLYCSEPCEGGPGLRRKLHAMLVSSLRARVCDYPVRRRPLACFKASYSSTTLRCSGPVCCGTRVVLQLVQQHGARLVGAQLVAT